MGTGLQTVKTELTPLEIIQKYESRLGDDTKVKTLSLNGEPLIAYLKTERKKIIFTVLKEIRPEDPEILKVMEEILERPNYEREYDPKEDRNFKVCELFTAICGLEHISPRNAVGFNEPKLDYTIIEIITNTTDEKIPLGFSSIHQLKFAKLPSGTLEIISQTNITSSFE